MQEYAKRFHHLSIDSILTKHKTTSTRGVTCHLDIMPKRCRTTGGRPRRSTKRQKGGILPLAALIPALVAGGKAVALGAASGAASYGAKKALEAATRKRRRR